MVLGVQEENVGDLGGGGDKKLIDFIFFIFVYFYLNLISVILIKI